MTSTMTRRTALTTLGTSSIAALTACSASLTTANTAGTHDSNGTSVVNNNSKAKASERSDYSGTVEFNSYDTSAGQYKPATRTSPPQNVPKPIKPENMDEHSVAGLYSAIGYLSAATSYAFVTSDLGPLDHLPFSDTYTNTFKKQIRETTQEMDGAWFEELKIAFTLNTAISNRPHRKLRLPRSIKTGGGFFQRPMTAAAAVSDLPAATSKSEPLAFPGLRGPPKYLRDTQGSPTTLPYQWAGGVHLHGCTGRIPKNLYR